MTGTLPRTQLSLVACIFLYCIVPLLEYFYGKRINIMNERETVALFGTSQEIEQVFGPQDQVQQMVIRMVKAVNTAPYSALGRFCARQEFKKRASARKAVMDYVVAHPKIQSVKLKAPLIVIGLPRSGTTLLHRLLACDPKVCGFKTFEMTQVLGKYVVPPPTEENWITHPNIAKTEKLLADSRFLFPTFLEELNESHYVGADEYEEESALTTHQLTDVTCIANNPEVEVLQENQEYMLQVYTYMKRYLQMLMVGFPNRKQVIMKCPLHTGSLPALLSVFPDARIICMHRNVKNVVPSSALMISRIESYKINDGAIDAKEYGQRILEKLVRMKSSMNKFRSLVEEQQVKLLSNVAVDAELRDHVVLKLEQFLDIEYKDLVDDPIATVRSIYKHYGMTVSRDFEDAMKLYVLENPQGKHATGKRVDATKLFGFNDNEIESAFADIEV
ncbi:hypothetical protein HDU79_005884 [Rhizoclosmatium sp. JEL0117]|nr:hypothetical protein HDU79_005884 [Rhizoclosmatium sp. JEL0117]